MPAINANGAGMAAQNQPIAHFLTFNFQLDCQSLSGFNLPSETKKPDPVSRVGLLRQVVAV